MDKMGQVVSLPSPDVFIIDFLIDFQKFVVDQIVIYSYFDFFFYRKHHLKNFTMFCQHSQFWTRSVKTVGCNIYGWQECRGTEIFSLCFLQLTTYTTLMHASTGTVETYIRFCKDPCFPWWKARPREMKSFSSVVP